MENIDKKSRLDEEVFSYRVSKNNTIFIDWYGKQVTILKEKEAQKFLVKMEQARNHKEKQLVMAKVTGNFKRGNEKGASH
ncbi:hypothetical protein BRE01_37640 [Brevibacillus reuszeri]|uniref:Uncharacterized protein n=1 Tax=Brevibacillus reuszeri TaxID=54915 RepID=A0A0K9YPE6_9BACL|nr:hypothetical protein [Brevibacillus reuszeri]KNB70522.1 hypothetical protein ADS79_16520 [Brevibacillus reuszeri]MED1861514.1 hypothetical protein [Brevibacillus reuszeri]GED70062.1 hypothetical protein BRE01_37640 [Brevibacillus reuszeri]